MTKESRGVAVSQVEGSGDNAVRDRRQLVSPAVVLTVVALIQFVILARAHVLPLASRIWDLRSESAIDRSARLAFGEDFAEFMTFLRNIVPADAKVIAPPMAFDLVYGNMGILQYYLFPRKIDNCGEHEIEACLLRVTGPNSYILALRGFPPRELAERAKVLAEFDAERGVYIPRQTTEGASP
jgi:hypothetical protein